ncbi:galactose oxidase-like domain-containing protein [Streptomyces sp. NPDC096339]|uniref:galactose oxidase-like domain-containing protein n=1 Tax=Streptomyces sp. NPDC096339 TaxID=3366086 RepID=UPI00382E2DDE
MPWNPTLIDAEILAVHAAFLNYDRIAYFAGSQYDPRMPTGIDNTRLYNCDTGGIARVSGGPGFDLFCSGHALSANGTLLAAGGTATYAGYRGVRDSAVIRYVPAGSEWKTVASFNENPNADDRESGGRWYPTLLTLANGNILALSGIPGTRDTESRNIIPEVFTPHPLSHGAWHWLGDYRNLVDRNLFAHHETPLYPRALLLPTGDVFLPVAGARGRTVTMAVKENPWSATFQDVCEFTPHVGADYSGYEETAVLLPLLAGENYARRRVLIAGGREAWILDLSHWDPGATPPDQLFWEPSERVLAGHPRRMHCNAVLLPTGHVLVVGGVAGTDAGESKDSTGVLTPEIYNPHTGKWSALTAHNEQAQIVRNYHSVALLMRDGRVWTAGSNHDGNPGVGTAEKKIEIYEPWYYGNPNRPEILAAPDRWVTGGRFVLRTTQASEIRRVAMVRTGSCTHAFNSDQRYVSLKFEYEGGDILNVTAAPNGNIAPSGMYFLYTINSQGLPSDGITIYQSTDPASDVEGAWEGLFRDS